MRKSFKKAVAVVSAIAMVVAGISYSPSNVSAADGTQLLNTTISTATGWTEFTSGGSTFTENTDGSLNVAVQAYAGGDNWATQVKYDGLSITSGKYYKASVTVNSDVARKFQLLVQQNNGDWAVLNTTQVFEVEAGVDKTFTTTFQASGDRTDVLFGIMMGYVQSASEAANVKISAVSFEEFDSQPDDYQEETTPEPTTAGADEDGFTPMGEGGQTLAPFGVYGEIYQAGGSWTPGKMSLKGAGANAGDLSVKITETNGNAGSWGLQVKYPYTLDASKEYTMAVNYSSTMVGTMFVKVEGADDGVTSTAVVGDNSYTKDVSGVTNVVVVLELSGFPVGTVIDMDSITFTEKSAEESSDEQTSEEVSSEEQSSEEESSEASGDYTWIAVDNGQGYFYNENHSATSIINVQKPGFADEQGIYMTVPAGISTVTINGVAQTTGIQGAGVVVYLSNLTQTINEVVINHGMGTSVVMIKNENAPSGEETSEEQSSEEQSSGSEEESTEPEVQVPAAPVGVTYAGNENLPYYFAWAPSAGATSYNVYVKGQLAATVSETAANLEATFFPAAGDYAIEVTAVNEAGESAKSTPYVHTVESQTTTYAVTVDGTKVADVEAGDTYTLPTTAQYGYFSGNDLYKAGAQVVVNNDIDFTSLTSVSVTMANGAVVKNTAPAGIAFQASVTVNGTTEAVNSAFLTEGMLITANDLYEELGGGELSLDSKYTFKNVTNEGWFGNAVGTYRAGISGVTSDNYIRKFIARGYAQLTYTDGTVTTVYSDMSPVRSIKQVAQSAIAVGAGNAFLEEIVAAE
ncbi:MAG: carbohydrate binding domain-containing protein [Eubacterium sp.]|nr:carbohydrate binding domain-containing protein [Eubacterium sp.]